MTDQPQQVRPHVPEPGLLQPVREPEDPQERVQSAARREEDRWHEERPPHYEPR